MVTASQNDSIEARYGILRHPQVKPIFTIDDNLQYIQKQYFRLGFSGPIAKKYNEDELLGYISQAIDYATSIIDKDQFELLICGGGTKCGFHLPLYNYANSLGLKTAGYCRKTHMENYEMYECDEIFYLLKLYKSANPNAILKDPNEQDLSLAFINDLNMHVALTSTNSEMKISLMEWELAQQRQVKDLKFKSLQYPLKTWV